MERPKKLNLKNYKILSTFGEGTFFRILIFNLI